MLETLGLTVGRGRTPVARLEDAALGAGDAALILGPSGSGKTTALFTLAGLLPPIDGMVRLDGEAFSGLPAHRRAIVRGCRMGVVFQDMHLLSGLSVLDNLLLAPFAAGLPQDRAAAFERLRAVGLEHLADRQAERLSRGEAQRVAVARVMLMTPRLLLAAMGPSGSAADRRGSCPADREGWPGLATRLGQPAPRSAAAGRRPGPAPARWSHEVIEVRLSRPIEAGYHLVEVTGVLQLANDGEKGLFFVIPEGAARIVEHIFI